MATNNREVRPAGPPSPATQPSIEGSALKEDGSVRPGAFIEVYVPAFDSTLSYKVVSQRNAGFDQLLLGDLPISESGVSAGAVPSDTLTSTYQFGFPDTRPISETQDNAFYYESDDTLIQAHIDIDPVFLRNFIEVPEGTPQLRYADADVTNRPAGDDVFGFWQGAKSFAFPPNLDIYFETYNPTNVDLRSAVDVTYAEYEVDLVTDPAMMKRIWLGHETKTRFTLPVFAQIRETFSDVIETYSDPETGEGLHDGRLHGARGSVPRAELHRARGGDLDARTNHRAAGVQCGLDDERDLPALVRVARQHRRSARNPGGDGG